LKYLSGKAVSWAIGQLRKGSHPFLGITFLVCKKAGLLVEKTSRIKLDTLTKNHLETHHRLDPQSEFYFQPFKSPKPWVGHKYASSGLQAINTQTFGQVFIHQKGSQSWGFKGDYVGKISQAVKTSSGYKFIPLTAIAIWIGKNDSWEDKDSLDSVVKQFLKNYHITSDERANLFTRVKTSELSAPTLFDEKPADLKAIAYAVGPPPDAPGETGGTLAALRLKGIGPAMSFDLRFGERLTLVAGDNGLGKSFLLDVAWWAITGKWVNKPAFPFVRLKDVKPTIKFEIRSATNQILSGSSSFDWRTHSWIHQKERPSVEALCIYAKVDNSFAVYDETREKLQAGDQSHVSSFTSNEVWNGKPGEIEGLVRDWVKWQLARDQEIFPTFARVLERLSPEDLGILIPGDPRRIPGDPRQIPTIKHSYGDVPIVFSSAGVQHVLLLAYLVIWTWQEHTVAARQIDEEPLRKMVIVVDEIEAHLHPRWQRTMLPALMSVGKLLSEELEIQIIASTHSPMVLASIEADFSEEADVLYHLALEDINVVLEPLEFQKYGDISAWLTSPVFGLKHARSRDAEKAIERAKTIQLAPTPDVSEIQEVSDRLRQLLASDDPFWPRWTYFAERFGVVL